MKQTPDQIELERNLLRLSVDALKREVIKQKNLVKRLRAQRDECRAIIDARNGVKHASQGANKSDNAGGSGKKRDGARAPKRAVRVGKSKPKSFP